MKIERIVILVFTILGLVSGIISSRLDPILALAISVAIWLAPTLLMIKYFTGKKRNWFLQNSVITFVLVWITVWILLFS